MSNSSNPNSSTSPTQRFVTHDFRGELIILGTGTSVGVPAIGCGCEVCQSDDPRNNRTRCSIALGLPEGNLLIDTPPDTRVQLLRENIGIVHSVLYTHEHADHVFGMDDLRLFQFYLGHAVPIYCTESVESRIRKSFDYAFATHEKTHAGAAPQIEFTRIDENPFSLLGADVIPIPMQHGPRFNVFGFRLGNVAYCTDTSHIPDASLEKLHGLDVLILDALRWTPHPTHMNIEEALNVVDKVKPKRTLFTHMNHDLDHETTNAKLPDSVDLAFDGQRIPLT